MAKEYMGDAVYVERDPNWTVAVKLTTSNGLHDTNTIILEPEVLMKFLDWVERAKKGEA